MESTTRVIRKGSIQGTKHAPKGINNQDSVEMQEFGVPKWGTNYRIGIVADGCTGVPAVSRSEVGSNLLTVFCTLRIQELLLAGAKPAEIPLPLYHAVTGFLRSLTALMVPASAYWPYPIKFTGKTNEFRNTLKAPQRFMLDYLSATILGFVDDGETLVVFRAGDGVIIVNGEISVIDQNDTPEYPSVSVNSPGAGFEVTSHVSSEIRQLALATDGLKKLLVPGRADMPQALFGGAKPKEGSLYLQFLLNRLRKSHGEFLDDDCTVLTLETFEEVDDASVAETAGD